MQDFTLLDQYPSHITNVSTLPVTVDPHITSLAGLIGFVPIRPPAPQANTAPENPFGLGAYFRVRDLLNPEHCGFEVAGPPWQGRQNQELVNVSEGIQVIRGWRLAPFSVNRRIKMSAVQVGKPLGSKPHSRSRQRSIENKAPVELHHRFEPASYCDRNLIPHKPVALPPAMLVIHYPQKPRRLPIEPPCGLIPGGAYAFTSYAST